MIGKAILASALIALSLLSGTAAQARTDCVVAGWTNIGTDNHPIWKCSEAAR